MDVRRWRRLAVAAVGASTFLLIAAPYLGLTAIGLGIGRTADSATIAQLGRLSIACAAGSVVMDLTSVLAGCLVWRAGGGRTWLLITGGIVATKLGVIAWLMSEQILLLFV